MGPVRKCPPSTPAHLIIPIKREAGSQNRRRCGESGCKKTALAGGLHPGNCLVLGGGHRCSEPGCEKAARRKGGACASHGGSKVCLHEGCRNKEKSRGYCKLHGGGQRCQVAGCTKS